MIVTHPGKLGDLLWALPTVRALATKEPVHLHLAAQCKPLVSLLEKQPYIHSLVLDENWQVQDTAPATPRVPPTFIPASERVAHLGYDRWPDLPLPFEVAMHAGLHVGSLDLSRWITTEPAFKREPSADIVLFHWTDRWFELKLGLTELVTQSVPLTSWCLRTDPNTQRWQVYKHAYEATFEKLASEIAAVSLVVTDCSAVHVLAAAIGTPVVVVEPEQDRHHFIFWPGSVAGPGPWHPADNALGRRIFPVLGNDGKPTFDARHTADLIREVLARG